jgi:hypothetical protein
VYDEHIHMPRIRLKEPGNLVRGGEEKKISYLLHEILIFDLIFAFSV